MEDKAAKEEERVLKALNEAAQKDQKLQAEKKGEQAEKEEKNNNEKTKNSKQADNKAVKKTDKKNNAVSKSTNKKSGSKSSKEIQRELEEQIEKKRKITAEITAIIVACVSVLTIIGVYFGGGGLIGQGISAFLKGIVGFGAYILPLLLIGVCFYVFFSESKVFSASKTILMVSMFFVLITFLHLIHINSKNPIHYDSFALFTKEMYRAGNYYNGGLFGAYIGSLLYKAMGKASSIIFVVMGFVCLGIFLTGQSLFDGIKRLWRAFTSYFVFEEKELEEELLEEESVEEEKVEVKNNIFKSLKNKLKPKKKAVLSDEEGKSVREKVKEQIRQEKKNEQSLEKNEEHYKLKNDDKEAKKEEKKIYREIPKPTIIDIKPENRNKPNHRLDIALDTVLTAERANLEPAKRNRVETNLPEFIKNREKFAYEKFLEGGQNKPKINGLVETDSKQYVDGLDGGYVIDEIQANSSIQEQATEPTVKEELPKENNSNIIDDSNIGEYFIDVSGLHQEGEHFFEPIPEENYADAVTEPKIENNEPNIENQTRVAEEIKNRPISRREQLEMLINSDDDFEEEFEEYAYGFEEKEVIENINNIERVEIAEANGSEETAYSEEMYEGMENEPIDISNLNMSNEEFSEVDLKTEEIALRAEEEDLPPWEDSYDEAYSDEENVAREALREAKEYKKPIESEKAMSNYNSSEKMSENSSQKVSNVQEPVIIKAEETKTVDKLNVEPKAEYVFPKLEFLGKNPNLNNSKNSEIELLENSKILVKTLASFNVDATVIEISKGPAVTRYELSIADGIKVSKILNLADNLALSLAATSIRIEAPIPGKAAVGIEIPNKEVTSVYLSEVVCDEKFQKFPSKLAFGLGKDIAGNVVVTNIAKMPHMLIAGATGSGKSVCINTLITSILYKSSPDEVRLIMVDPKVVELSVYNGIPHLLIPVVTEADKAAGALNWAVHEMMERYNKFAQTGTRNLEGYNKLLEERGEIKLPQIVIIIDELADLMMVAAKEVEAAICRLAQLARAAGLHLIIATQRPSVDVITGLIKANIPSRIAFAVSSGTDSRTIIDTVGAEKLLGKGDMLFKAVDMNKPLRVQGAFVTDSEVEKIVSFLKENNPVDYDQEVINKIATMKSGESSGSGGSSDVSDEMTDEVIAFIVRNGKCSTSLIQRKFRLGYNRAARIVEELEDRGIIGPENGSKPREVLMDKYQMEEYFTRNAGY